MASLRCFIALPTPPDVRDRIAAIQARLKEAGADVRWEPPEKFHITLKFLGNIEEDVLRQYGARLEAGVVGVGAFNLSYIGVGAFPDLRRPRVVWICAEKHEVLTELQKRTENLAAEFGYVREDRPFHPHITLGRVKGNRNLAGLTERLKNITFEAFQARCSEVLIMRSDLKPTGSVYTLVRSVPLTP